MWRSILKYVTKCLFFWSNVKVTSFALFSMKAISWELVYRDNEYLTFICISISIHVILSVGS